MIEEPLVTVIIVNYNGKKELEDCLSSLMKNSYSNYEVILVDNNSKDDSIEFVKNTYSHIKIIELEKNYGFAFPNNIGAKKAKGDLLLFLNNDTKQKHNFISELVKEILNDPKIAICQSLLLKTNGEIDSSGDFIDSIGVCYSSKVKIEKISNILSAKGASMMIRKDIFEKIGKFDEKFFASFEDVDLGWRSWILGFKVVVVPKSVVYHIGGTTIEKMKEEMTFHRYKNQLSMKLTNFESNLALKNIIKFFFRYGIREIRISIDYKFKGRTKIQSTEYEEKIAQKPSLVKLTKAVFWLFKNYKYLKKKHKQVNSNRVMSTSDMRKLKIIRN